MSKLLALFRPFLMLLLLAAIATTQNLSAADAVYPIREGYANRTAS